MKKFLSTIILFSHMTAFGGEAGDCTMTLFHWADVEYPTLVRESVHHGTVLSECAEKFEREIGTLMREGSTVNKQLRGRFEGDSIAWMVKNF